MGKIRSSLIRKVGRKIAELRRDSGVTQEAMAAQLDVSTWWVRRVELGRENLTLETMEKLAEALEAEVIDFFAAPSPGAEKVRRGRPKKRS